MATLIKVGDVLEWQPLARSPDRARIVSEILNKGKITPEYVQQDFALYLAGILKLRIKHSIDTQSLGKVSFKSIYKPLSKDYKATKVRRNRDKFWVNTEHLVNNITVWRTGKIVRIGFKGKAYYPGTRLRVLQVVMWMERGTKNKDGSEKMPPRPLFLPHARMMSKNVGAYFDKYAELRFGIDLKKLR